MPLSPYQQKLVDECHILATRVKNRELVIDPNKEYWAGAKEEFEKITANMKAHLAVLEDHIKSFDK